MYQYANLSYFVILFFVVYIYNNNDIPIAQYILSSFLSYPNGRNFSNGLRDPLALNLFFFHSVCLFTCLPVCLSVRSCLSK